MSYYSCDLIENNLTIDGRIDDNQRVLRFCCEHLEDIPWVSFADTPEETLRNFLGLREQAKAEGKKKEAHRKKDILGFEGLCTKTCEKCSWYQNKEGHSNGLINYVSLAMYPAPCQCKCIYCTHHSVDQSTDREETKQAYNKLFDTIEYAKKTGVIHPDAIWQISTGEITIHPYRERIMDLVEGEHAVFYTNCFKFDERIAKTLHTNPKAQINLSIDSGTPETWKKVKGFNNFDKVTENLVKYYNESVRAGQITLKYIILPGINDTLEDYMSLMEIMKVIEVPELSISRHFGKKYNINTQEYTDIVGAMAYLIAVCVKNGIRYNNAYAYTPQERMEAETLAKEILEKGLV